MNDRNSHAKETTAGFTKDRRHLRVVEESVSMVGTATGTVWSNPSSVELRVMPALLKTQHRRVNTVADRQVAEVFAEVDECHPALKTHTSPYTYPIYIVYKVPRGCAWPVHLQCPPSNSKSPKTSLFLQRLTRSASSSLLHYWLSSIFGCWPPGVELPATGGYVGTVTSDLPHSTQKVSVY